MESARVDMTDSVGNTKKWVTKKFAKQYIKADKERIALREGKKPTKEVEMQVEQNFNADYIIMSSGQERQCKQKMLQSFFDATDHQMDLNFYSKRLKKIIKDWDPSQEYEELKYVIIEDIAYKRYNKMGRIALKTYENPFVPTFFAWRKSYDCSMGNDSSFFRHYIGEDLDYTKGNSCEAQYRVLHDDGTRVMPWNRGGTNAYKRMYRVLDGNEDEWRETVHSSQNTLFFNAPLLEAFVPGIDSLEISREGYSFRIPPILNVGDSITTSTVTLRNKQVEKRIYFSNAFVTAEEDVSTKAGTFHCYKIESKMYEGTAYDTPLEVFTYNLWIAPKVGLVKVETDYKNMSMVLSSITD